MSPPRIFCIPAAAAPVVAVLRRGPSDWWHVGRWDLAKLAFEPGAWFRAQLYPQKCDLSPDGRWLAYSALNAGADWPAGEIYEAVSRLPWLHALAAWEAGTTYTRGIHFLPGPGPSALGDPDVGDVTPLLERHGIALNRPEQFSVERRRGWEETGDTEPRHTSDTWDQRRRVRMRKPRPGGGCELQVAGSYAAFRDIPHLREPAEYSLWTSDDVEVLDVQWADWDPEGRLLVATSAGRLRMYADPFERSKPQSDHDLSNLTPTPAPPPQWAKEW